MLAYHRSASNISDISVLTAIYTLSIIIHHWSYISGESSNSSCVSICVSIRTHISVTADNNFLIWGMMMDYDVGLMPIVSKF